jgi:hypothetical protein
MRIRVLVLLVPILCSFLGLGSADEPPKALPGRTVGSVYGKAVTAADVGLTAPVDPSVGFDARDTVRWKLMGRIMTAFGGPVMDRFVEEQKIEAMPEEIETFKRNLRKSRERSLRKWEARLVEINEALAAKDLSNEERAKLKEQQAMYEKLVASMSERRGAEVSGDVARVFIVAWKTERALHREYGGRVIFQQAGPEALDGRRRLFEEAEKNGEIKFDDPGVRHLFYYYANMRHTVIDAKALDRPWFLEDGT